MAKKYNIEITFIKGFDNPGTTGIIIGWTANGIGYGELTIKQKGKKLFVDSECMSRNFSKAVLIRLLESCKEK